VCRMSHNPARIMEARRARLRAWIDAHYAGSQAAFVKATGINQGGLSSLLRSKTFGENRAAAIERIADMPEGYLVFPLDGPDHAPVAVQLVTRRFEDFGPKLRKLLRNRCSPRNAKTASEEASPRLRGFRRTEKTETAWRDFVMIG